MGGPLKIHGKLISRVENYCATGSEAMRQAAYAVASGAYDVVMALGAEKVTDSGYQGLNTFPIPSDGTQRTLTAAAKFSLMLPAYAQRYGVDEDRLRYAAARIAEKNHANGARNPLAQFRRQVAAADICEMPAVAGRLSVFDCAGVSDPRSKIALAEVHDCFTPTELVLMQDLGFSERGRAWSDVLDGHFDIDGRLPVNTDGGLKSFGHPVGASGLRMLYEIWLQLRGAAPAERRIPAGERSLGLTHNLGGYPGEMVSFVGIYGTRPG